MSEQRSNGPDLWVRLLINLAGVVIGAGLIAIIVATIVTELD